MEQKQKILLVVMTDVDPEHEEDLNRWYDEEHLPALLKVPGVLSARRFRLAPDTGISGKPATGQPQKYLTIYEHESIEVQRTEAYQKVRSTPWAERVRLHFKNHSRHFYVQIFPHEDAKP